jgi:hypothetical protein
MRNGFGLRNLNSKGHIPMIQHLKVYVVLAMLTLLIGLALPTGSDTILDPSSMASSFGGTIVQGDCCRAMDKCDVTPDSCPTYNNDETACESNHQITVQSSYARMCSAPDTATPTSSCQDFEKDLTGAKYYCVAYFDCIYNGFLTTCTKGPANLNLSIPGWYACASNCPPGDDYE